MESKSPPKRLSTLLQQLPQQSASKKLLQLAVTGYEIRLDSSFTPFAVRDLPSLPLILPGPLQGCPGIEEIPRIPPICKTQPNRCHLSNRFAPPPPQAYLIAVRDGRKQWKVFRRYNQFYELDAKVPTPAPLPATVLIRLSCTCRLCSSSVIAPLRVPLCGCGGDGVLGIVGGY
jgi:hypothetical protein